MTDVTARKAWLVARKAELNARMERIEDALDGPFTKDVEDNAIEHEEDEVLGQLGQSGQAEVAKIDAALARIEDGSYGICGRCGEDISQERLDVLPFTALCAPCAQAIEKNDTR